MLGRRGQRLGLGAQRLLRLLRLARIGCGEIFEAQLKAVAPRAKDRSEFIRQAIARALLELEEVRLVEEEAAELRADAQRFVDNLAATREGVLQPFTVSGVAIPTGTYDHRELQIVGCQIGGCGIRSRLGQFERVRQWEAAPLDLQLRANGATRPFIMFLLVTGRLVSTHDEGGLSSALTRITGDKQRLTHNAALARSPARAAAVPYFGPRYQGKSVSGSAAQLPEMVRLLSVKLQAAPADTLAQASIISASVAGVLSLFMGVAALPLLILTLACAATVVLLVIGIEHSGALEGNRQP